MDEFSKSLSYLTYISGWVIILKLFDVIKFCLLNEIRWIKKLKGCSISKRLFPWEALRRIGIDSNLRVKC